MFAFMTHIRAEPGKRNALIQANNTMQAITAVFRSNVVAGLYCRLCIGAISVIALRSYLPLLRGR